LKPAISRLSRDPPAPAVLESLWNAVILQSRETTELPQFFTLRIWLFLLEFLPLAVSFPPTVCRFAEATLNAALALPAGLDKDGLSRGFLLALRRQRAVLEGAGFPAVKRLLGYEAMSSNVAPFLLLWLEGDCATGAKDEKGATNEETKGKCGNEGEESEKAVAPVAQNVMEEWIAVGRFVVRNVYQSRVKSDYLAIMAMMLRHVGDVLPRFVNLCCFFHIVFGAGRCLLHRPPRGNAEKRPIGRTEGIFVSFSLPFCIGETPASCVEGDEEIAPVAAVGAIGEMGGSYV
jgi:hypothetical protein